MLWGVGHEYHGKWQTLKRSDLQSYTCKCGYPSRKSLFPALPVLRAFIVLPPYQKCAETTSIYKNRG